MVAGWFQKEVSGDRLLEENTINSLHVYTLLHHSGRAAEGTAIGQEANEDIIRLFANLFLF